MKNPSVNLEFTINSGQVFLWKNDDSFWYGINGLDIIKINKKNLTINSLSKRGQDIFRESDNMEEIINVVSKDKIVFQAQQKFPGLRIVRQEPFQCLISFIVSSNSNIQKIKSNLQKLCENFGERVIFEEKEFFLFPTPERLSKASLKEIQDCGVGYRAKFIKSAAEMVFSKKIDFDKIKNSDYFKAKRMLKTIPGIGNKVADCILLFSLEKTEAFPLDRWMIRILQKYYSEKFSLQTKTITDKQYDLLHEKIVKHFGPFAGYAQQYLFKMERENFAKKW